MFIIMIFKGLKKMFHLKIFFEDKVKISGIVGKKKRLVSESTKGTRVWCIEGLKIYRILCQGENLRKIKE